MGIEYTPEQTSMMEEIKSRGSSGYNKKRAMRELQKPTVVAGPKPTPVSSTGVSPAMDAARAARLRASQDRQSTGTGSFRRPSSY